ncbi:MAG: queuine tRNA-ribosyltransferase family protein [Acidimicrobiia bacterium]|nr:queuine tRNA-ribosyltransferase family protein [Acidimicrobiia bacterium]
MELLPDLPPLASPAPVFVPDATYGVVRGVGGDELTSAGVRLLMVNAFHLLRSPGVTRVNALGGLATMMGFPGLVMTDSGGFQAYSLIRENARFGTITKNGLTFVSPDGAKVKLTPERAIVNQRRLGADIAFCLDDCTHADDPSEEQRLSVDRTLAWARRCKDEFTKSLGDLIGEPDRPRLFAVVQGGRDEVLRRRCAEELLEIGFDGYGFGGWPLDGDGNLLIDTFALLRELIPAEFSLHALGVGHPVSIARCFELGYATFDSSLPTRDARRGRLYRFRDGAPSLSGDWFEKVYLRDDVHQRSRAPISDECHCVACTHYSLGYLNHLLRRDEPLLLRLATLHNLTFMRQVTDLLAAPAA